MVVGRILGRTAIPPSCNANNLGKVCLDAKYAEISSRMRDLVVVANVPEEMRRKLELCLTCDQTCPGIKKCKK